MCVTLERLTVSSLLYLASSEPYTKTLSKNTVHRKRGTRISLIPGCVEAEDKRETGQERATAVSTSIRKVFCETRPCACVCLRSASISAHLHERVTQRGTRSPTTTGNADGPKEGPRRTAAHSPARVGHPKGDEVPGHDRKR